MSSNRKWRENAVTTGKSEPYTYDRLNRLTKAERGDLNGGKDAISSTNFRQDWLLSAVGNWDRFRTDSDGNDPWDSNQTRGHNKVNEITAIGDSNAHLAYDLAGNMTKVPRPCDEANHHYVCTYDAWNRLVKVQDETPATMGRPCSRSVCSGPPCPPDSPSASRCEGSSRTARARCGSPARAARTA